MGVPTRSTCFSDGACEDRDGGGAVDSVNGETGVVVLDAADVGAVPNDAVGLWPGETNRGTWDIAETYAVGDVVFETGGDLYVATAPSTGAQPSLTPGSWDVLDPTGRRIHLGPAATAGDFGLAVGPAATAGDFGLAVGPAATAGDSGLAVGLVATSGDGGLSVGPAATAGDYGLAVGPAVVADDYEVNIANIYTGTLDPGDPTTPLTATIATGHVDLPETADATNPPADHQRLVARTNGLYVRDQTGTEVGPLGGAVGSGPPAPASPSAYDDEFDGSSSVVWLDTPTAATTKDIDSFSPGCLHLKGVGTGSNMIGVVQAAPGSFPYTITSRIVGRGAPVNYHRHGGIILCDGITSGATIWYAGQVWEGAELHRAVCQTFGGAYIGGDAGWQGRESARYIRVTVDSASSASAYLSDDGYVWVEYDTFNPGFTPTHFGLGCSQESSGSVPIEATFGFFRVEQ